MSGNDEHAKLSNECGSGSGGGPVSFPQLMETLKRQVQENKERMLAAKKDLTEKMDEAEKKQNVEKEEHKDNAPPPPMK